jgi:hypothetical protein
MAMIQKIRAFRVPGEPVLVPTSEHVYPVASRKILCVLTSMVMVRAPRQQAAMLALKGS